MGARFSAPVQNGPGSHPASCTMGTGSFPGVKCSRGVPLTTHPLLVPWSRKSRAIPLLPYGLYGLYRASVPVQYSYTSTPSMGLTVCTEPQRLYSTAIPLLPYGLYSLYRASVPVQGCTLLFTLRLYMCLVPMLHTLILKLIPNDNRRNTYIFF